MGDTDRAARGSRPDPVFGRATLVGLLVSFAVPPVLLALAPAVSPAWLVPTAAVAVPLAAVTLVLGRLARRVGASPDEPALVDAQVSEATGVTSEEYEDLFD